MSPPLRPQFHGRFDPVYPCREMSTRHCPAVYDAECGDDRPCARYESQDPTPWIPELEHPERLSTYVSPNDKKTFPAL